MFDACVKAHQRMNAAMAGQTDAYMEAKSFMFSCWLPPTRAYLLVLLSQLLIQALLERLRQAALQLQGVHLCRQSLAALSELCRLQIQKGCVTNPMALGSGQMGVILLVRNRKVHKSQHGHAARTSCAWVVRICRHRMALKPGITGPVQAF